MHHRRSAFDVKMDEYLVAVAIRYSSANATNEQPHRASWPHQPSLLARESQFLVENHAKWFHRFPVAPEGEFSGRANRHAARGKNLDPEKRAAHGLPIPQRDW